jgi:hypothetical protein
MRLFLLDGLSKPSIHPIFGHLGTWSDGSVCKVCGNANSLLIEPLQVEWYDGSANIGDFSWCGYTAVVLDRVKAWLTDNRFEVAFGRVEVMKPKGRARMPRVAFPYTGPNLSWMRATARVALDEARSGLEKKADCVACGAKLTKFSREGLFIPKTAWKGEKLFVIDQFGKSSAKFITEEALAKLDQMGFTGYVTMHAGEIED